MRRRSSDVGRDTFSHVLVVHFHSITNVIYNFHIMSLAKVHDVHDSHADDTLVLANARWSV